MGDGCDAVAASDADTLPGTPPVPEEQMHVDEAPTRTCDHVDDEAPIFPIANAARNFDEIEQATSNLQLEEASDPKAGKLPSGAITMSPMLTSNVQSLHSIHSQTSYGGDANNHVQGARFPWANSASASQQRSEPFPSDGANQAHRAQFWSRGEMQHQPNLQSLKLVQPSHPFPPVETMQDIAAQANPQFADTAQFWRRSQISSAMNVRPVQLTTEPLQLSSSADMMGHPAQANALDGTQFASQHGSTETNLQPVQSQPSPQVYSMGESATQLNSQLAQGTKLWSRGHALNKTNEQPLQFAQPSQPSQPCAWDIATQVQSQLVVDPSSAVIARSQIQPPVSNSFACHSTLYPAAFNPAIGADMQQFSEQTHHARTKPNVSRRLKSRMLVQGQKFLDIPCSQLPSGAELPQIAYLPVEDPTTGNSYILCNFCKSDKIFSDAAGLVRHLESGDCPLGYEELCRVRADIHVLESSKQRSNDITSRGGSALPRTDSKLDTCSTSRFTSRGSQLERMRPHRQVQRKLGKATTKLKYLRELQRISPRLFHELGSSIRGLLNCTSSELSRIVAEARRKPECNPSLDDDGNDSEDQPLVKPSDFASVHKAFRQHLVPMGPDTCREDEHLSALQMTCRSLVVEVEKSAAFSLADCRSKFLEQDLQLDRFF